MQRSTEQVLRSAIERLSQPFESPKDVRAVSIELDGIAADLLSSSYVTERIGPGLVSELSAEGPELPSILREIGGEEFMRAAACANDLLAIGTSSLIDFGTAEDEVLEANEARKKLHDAFLRLLIVVDG
jgi:hypothetical protein